MSLKSLKIVQKASYYWKSLHFSSFKKASGFLKSLTSQSLNSTILEKPSHSLKKNLNFSENVFRKNPKL
jgi:hypothetical protein